MGRASSSLFLFAALFVSAAAGDETKGGKKDPAPPFFLQDGTDGLCLADGVFQRCGLDTLFYVVGTPGSYQIRKRLLLDAEDEPVAFDQSEEKCLTKPTCAKNEEDTEAIEKVEPLALGKCTHCGSKRWNILGDATSGYVLSENGGKTCLYREKKEVAAEDGESKKDSKSGPVAMLAPCSATDTPYTPLQLQFASKDDIKKMASPVAQLIAAASDGDAAGVHNLLRNDANSLTVNSVDWDGLTALVPAANQGHEEIVKFLIEQGADLHAKDKDGVNPLMEASVMGHTAVVKMLLDAGASASEVSDTGVSALWLAAGEGRLEVVKLLFEVGHADINNARADGVTALMAAAAGGHPKTVKYLLDKGVDPQAEDKDGLPALATAAEKGNLEVLQSIFAAVPEKERDEHVNHMSTTGFTALIVASAHGHNDCVTYLVEDAAAEVDQAQEETKVTALMYAAASGHLDVVKTLLKHGADVNKAHTNDGTALLESCTAGQLEILKTLVEKGAKYDIVDKDGVTPLMSAASQGHYDCVQYLVEKLKESMSPEVFQEYLNRLSYSGGSAVMFSSAAGIANITSLLIKEGANYDEVAKATPEYLEALAEAISKGTVPEDQEPHIDGVSSMHVAAQGGHIKTLKVLLEAGAEVNVKDEEDRTPLLLAVKGNYGDIAVELVSAGANPNMPYKDDEGNDHNLLMDAIIVENEEFALALIEKGADYIAYRDDQKISTLLQASHRGLTVVVKALLNKHAALKDKDEEAYKEYLNAKSDESITPLIASASEGHTDVVDLLLATPGVDKDILDKDGTTAVMAASARGHVGPARSLIKAGADINVQNADGHTALMFAYNGKNQVETLYERYHQYVVEAKDKAEDGMGGSEEGAAAVTASKEVDDAGTGPIIEGALKNHTDLVQALVDAGADQTLKDKEGHLAIDFDFKPESEVDKDILEKEEKVDRSKNEL